MGIRTLHDGQGGTARGENMVFSVEIDGVHICHLGDLGHLLTDEQLSERGGGAMMTLTSLPLAWKVTR